jgi:predicted enzyme related to lactoylglutathione lyase
MALVKEAVKISGIDVTTYLTKDPDRALEFYRDVMELPVLWRSEQGAEFELPDGSTFGLWRMEDGSWHSAGIVMFAVPDAKAAADYYRSRGAQIAPHIEENGNCFMAFGQDSEGNEFILHQRKTA